MIFAEQNTLHTIKRTSRALTRTLLASCLSIVTIVTATAAIAAGTGVPLSDLPLFSAAQVPANLLLTLSVEYPTANSIANSAAFNPVNTNNTNGISYVGYFDPNLCYTYVYNTQDLSTGGTISTATDYSGTPNYYAENASLGDSGDYFKASSIANTTTGACAASWSGAFLNWAAMQTIDPFRWALTGGYRSYDGPSTTYPTAMTILKKAWASGDGGSNETPVQSLPSSYSASSYTPLGWSSLYVRVWGLGTRMQFASSNAFDGNTGSTADTPWNGQTATTNSSGGAAIYSVKIRVKACDNALIPTYTLPSWCTLYPNGRGTGLSLYKPEGLIQQYSTGATVNGVYKPPSIRFAAMGYLNDSYLLRDAGVLRARMEFVGPTAPMQGNQTATNNNAEWSATSGVFVLNPDSSDATATNTAAAAALSGGCGSNGTCVTASGVVGYLNGFGENTKSYKTYDPVDELYYAGIRYFKGPYSATNTGGGNVPAWSDLTTYQGGTPSANNLYSMIGGYPVIQTWDDPILYACQKNFILGIGDINAHSGGNVAGSFVNSQPEHTSNNEPAEDPLVSNDVSVAVGYTNTGSGSVAATNYIGTLEGVGLLGTVNVDFNGNLGNCCGDDNTFLMAGLAYDAHVADMRPSFFKTADNLDSNGNKLQIQTLTTYWLDVQEYQNYYYQNEFWLTAKYGGFTVPTATKYVPYTSAFPAQSSWSAANNTDASQPGPGGGGSGHPMPNNYYGAGNAQAMVNGLTSAFASIAASSSATTTGLAASNYNSVGTAFGSYAVQYDASTWSSDVTAYSTTFSASGQPSTVKLWDSRSTVSGYQTTGSNPVNELGQFSVFPCGTTGHTINGFQRPDGVTVPSGCSNFGTRTIATSKGGTATGIPFEIASLSSTEVAALYTVPNTTMATLSLVPATNTTRATALLSYLRGDQSNEYGVTAGDIGFRARTYLEGDVVNSALVPVGPPSLSYTEAADPGYPEFVNAHTTRSTVVYAGANDGMMHAYQGSLTPSTQGPTSFVAAGGSEMFSYVPSPTFLGPDLTPTDAGLAALANPNFNHHFYVDATPVITDVDFANTYPNVGTTGTWATELIGGMGKGGRSYYALNVTSPDSLKTSETVLAQNVLWEFTDTQMGYTVGTPLLVKTASYGWTAVLMSGMNACPYVALSTACNGYATDTSGGQSFIYLVNPSTGALYQKITIPAGSTTTPDGASYVTALQNITTGSVDALYFGDLLGNLWRLDLRVACSGTVTTGCDNSRTTLAYGAPIIMAQFTDGSSSPQPQAITTRPTIVIDPNTGNRYVTVGTGKLLSSADLSTNQQQTFYTILDGTATTFLPSSTYTTPHTPLTRANLANLDGAADTSTVCGVDTLAAGVTLSGSQSGWYFDMGVPNPSPTAVSCRMNISALAGVDGTITFAANIPSGSTCNPSGSNQIFSFQASTGAPLIVTTNANGNTVVNTAGYTAAGGAVSSLSQFNNAGGISTNATTQSGSNSNLPAAPPTNTNLNRLNWREVPAVD